MQGALWVQKRCVPHRCRFCQGPWRTSVLLCAVWLQKVWPGWFRWWETLASMSPSRCSALTGRKFLLYRACNFLFLFVFPFLFLFETKFSDLSLERAERNQVKSSHCTNSHKVVKCQWNNINTSECDTELGFSQRVLYSEPLKSFTEEGFLPLVSIVHCCRFLLKQFFFLAVGYFH